MSYSDGELSNHVVTRWYKPPELLLGSTNYGTEVDMWCIGCVFFEMLTGHPPFPGNDETHQLQLILKLCGTNAFFEALDTPQTPQSLSALPHFNEVIQTLSPIPSRLKSRISHLPSEAQDLLSQLLSVDPQSRISAEEAFDHDFFYTGVDPANEEETTICPFSVHEYELKTQAKIMMSFDSFSKSMSNRLSGIPQ